MTKIASREKGSGKTLVCLHGYGGSVLHWEQVTNELTQYFKIVTPNLTHLFMGTDLLTFSQQLEQVADFIRTQSPNEAVSVLGISYGGALAWGLALKYPDLVEKVIFINPMPPFANRYFAIPSLRHFFAIPWPVSIVHMFLGSRLGSTFLREAAGVFRNLQGETGEDRVESLRGRKLKFVSHIFWKFSWILRSENWQSWEVLLADWHHNCMLIYDRKDPLFAPDFYDGFARRLSSNNVVTTQDAGHISILQQPRLIAGVIREYLLRDYFKSAAGYGE